MMVTQGCRLSRAAPSSARTTPKAQAWVGDDGADEIAVGHWTPPVPSCGGRWRLLLRLHGAGERRERERAGCDAV